MKIFGSMGVETNYLQVQNYAALPLASQQTGKIYIVQEPQGTWLINRKRAGLWRSDGETWTRLGVLPTYEEIGADAAGSAATVQSNLNTHTANESNPHSVTVGQVGAMIYVDRGDPEFEDFSTADFTKDGNWHVLDLSSIVPEGAVLVHLCIKIYSLDIGGFVQLRKNGNINNRNSSLRRVYLSDISCYESEFVACDVDRKIEYRTTDSWKGIEIRIRGWFK